MCGWYSTHVVRQAVALSYAWLGRWPARQLFRGCGASIHARHLVHSLVAPQSMATSSRARGLHATAGASRLEMRQVQQVGCPLGRVKPVTAFRHISLLEKFEAKLATSTPKLVDLFFFRWFYLNLGSFVPVFFFFFYSICCAKSGHFVFFLIAFHVPNLVLQVFLVIIMLFPWPYPGGFFLRHVKYAISRLFFSRHVM